MALPLDSGEMVSTPRICLLLVVIRQYAEFVPWTTALQKPFGASGVPSQPGNVVSAMLAPLLSTSTTSTVAGFLPTFTTRQRSSSPVSDVSQPLASSSAPAAGGLVYGIDRFGMSAPLGDLQDRFGFTGEKLAARVRGHLGRKA